ncbi:hypothetical protein c7_L1152 [Megavirus courdo7]|uniref:Uncharacterized protein n=1 Tax=Megavirus courdo7 TaxID=1128135 RepID=H2EC76_9VIRU|nr:hypothetical protein c7_L1152 [Megavirus courdo7]
MKRLNRICGYNRIIRTNTTLFLKNDYDTNKITSKRFITSKSDDHVKSDDIKYQMLLCDYHQMNTKYNKLVDYKTKIKNVPVVKPKSEEYIEISRKTICYMLLFDSLGWYIIYHIIHNA